MCLCIYIYIYIYVYVYIYIYMRVWNDAGDDINAPNGAARRGYISGGADGVGLSQLSPYALQRACYGHVPSEVIYICHIHNCVNHKCLYVLVCGCIFMGTCKLAHSCMHTRTRPLSDTLSRRIYVMRAACIAVCCSVLQCVALCCCALQTRGHTQNKTSQTNKLTSTRTHL